MAQYNVRLQGQDGKFYRQTFEARNPDEAIRFANQIAQESGTEVVGIPFLGDQGGLGEQFVSPTPLGLSPSVVNAQRQAGIDRQLGMQGAGQGTPLDTQRQAGIDAQLGMQGVTQGGLEQKATAPIAVGSGVNQFDFMTDEGGGKIYGMQSAAEKEFRKEQERLARLEAEAEAKRLEEERIAKEKAGYLSNNNPVKDPIIDKVSGGDDWERKLVDSKTSPDGTLLRKYEYTQFFLDKNQKRTGKSETSSAWFIVNADGADNLQDAEQFELPITEEAWNANKGVLTLDPNDILFFQVKEGAIKDELEEAWMRDASSEEVDVPDWFEAVLNANGRSITPTTNIDGPRDKRIIYDFRSGEYDPAMPGGPGPGTGTGTGPGTGIGTGTGTGEGGEDAGGGGLAGAGAPGGPGTFDPSFDYATGDKLPEGPGGPGEVANQYTDADGNTVRIRSLESGADIEYPGDPFPDFLSAEGFNLPKDKDGNPIQLDRMNALPGFPTEYLDPQNLFIRVTEDVERFTEQIDPVTGEPMLDADGNPVMSRTVETRTRWETNPAVSAALTLYGQKLSALTGLQESSDRMIQAQISATGGLMPGPAGGLTQDEFNDIAGSLRTIASSGGRLTSSLKEGQDGITSLITEMTDLGKQELTQEALRQSGGLLGGYWTQDAEGNQVFQQGLKPEDLLNTQNQQELLRIQAENLPDMMRNQYEARQAQDASRANILNQIAGIYSNPAQLAAIVQAGGGPLLQLQEELRKTSEPFAVQNFQQPTAIPYGPADPSQTDTQAQGTATTPLTNESTLPTPGPSTGGSPISGTIWDENFLEEWLPMGTFPVFDNEGNQIGTENRRYTKGEYMMEQGIPISPPNQTTANLAAANGNAFNLPAITHWNPRASEQFFNLLSPINQQQFIGSAAASGKGPQEVALELEKYTPGDSPLPLYGVGGTSSIPVPRV